MLLACRSRTCRWIGCPLLDHGLELLCVLIVQLQAIRRACLAHHVQCVVVLALAGLILLLGRVMLLLQLQLLRLRDGVGATDQVLVIVLVLLRKIAIIIVVIRRRCTTGRDCRLLVLIRGLQDGLRHWM